MIESSLKISLHREDSVCINFSNDTFKVIDDELIQVTLNLDAPIAIDINDFQEFPSANCEKS